MASRTSRHEERREERRVERGTERALKARDRLDDHYDRRDGPVVAGIRHAGNLAVAVATASLDGTPELSRSGRDLDSALDARHRYKYEVDRAKEDLPLGRRVALSGKLASRAVKSAARRTV